MHLAHLRFWCCVSSCAQRSLFRPSLSGKGPLSTLKTVPVRINSTTLFSNCLVSVSSRLAMGNKHSDSKTKDTDTSGSSKQEEEFVEAVAAKTGELADGEMREVDLGQGKALLVYQDGEYSAIGHKCTHYGAPLAKGCLGNGRVRCPWHGACFNIKTGDIEDFPGLDGIHKFEVRVDEGNIVVKAKKSALEKTKRTMDMCAADKEDKRTFLIIGGGPAAQECAETLRQDGYKGRIVMATRENVGPYDRPKLSKAMTVKPEDIVLRKQSFYEENNITVMLNKEATGVNTTEKSVKFADDSTLNYDCLFLATGSMPRKIPVPGIDLGNVFLLRDPVNANDISEAAKDKKVVMVGTGFIGMEVAAYLCGKAASVTCIDLLDVPFSPILGPEVGKAIQKFQENKGVKFELGVGLKEFQGEDGKVTGVVLSNDKVVEADVCVVGIGVVPATVFLKDSGLNLTQRGEVVVDQYMKVADNVYAGGDVVRFPLPLIGDTANIGHWQLANKHGRVAAKNMLGQNVPFDSIPFFWTVLHGKSIRYCGHALKWDDIIISGDPMEFKFVAHYVKDNKVLAVCSMNADPAVSTAAELMYQGKMPSGDEIKENPGILLEWNKYTEAKVTKVGEMKDGEMKEVDLGQGKALLVYQDGEYSAIGHKCTHFGAPLAKGYLGNGRVRCPWHGACFNVKTGDIEDFPGLDGIHKFEVKVVGEDVIVKAEKAALKNFRRTLPMCSGKPEEDSRTFLIIGGGPAAQECVETLRQQGFKGRVIMAAKESSRPYDRTLLSKRLMATAQDIALRPATFYDEHFIELRLEKEATGIDTTEKIVKFADGGTIKYDVLFIGTGSTPRKLDIPGSDLKNIFVLRSPSQGNAFATEAKDKKVVVIGGGFIGIEVVASMCKTAASVTCVARREPFVGVFGEEVAVALKKLNEDKGAAFVVGDSPVEFKGENGQLTGVVLQSGKVLEADVCLLGLGVTPSTEFLKGSGFNMTERGEVVVDEYMKVADNVYAGGDVVRFPLPLIGDTANIGHWQIANKHGRVAAKNMLGQNVPFDSIPFFWTMFQGKSVRYCGHAATWDDIIIEGNPQEYNFVAHFVKAGKVVAVAAMTPEPTVAKAAELLYSGKMYTPEEIRNTPGLLKGQK